MARGFKSGGKQKGTKNKATLEREHRAIEVLQQKSLAPLRPLAKEELAELVPVVKGMVAQFQMAAMNSGLPGADGWRPELWKELRDWIRMYASVADLAADFESPRYRAIAVLDATEGKIPYVVRAPAVMADSASWQAAVGAAVLEIEAAQVPSGGQPSVSGVSSASTAVTRPIEPVPAPVALVADQKTGRVTVMPPGPRVVQPAGTAEWLERVAAEKRRVGG